MSIKGEYLGPAISIFLVALVLAGIIKFVQIKFVDRKRMKLLQKEIKEDNKKMLALIREGDKRKKELDELQQRMMANQMVIMNSSMRLNVIILPVFLIALWALSFFYSGESFESFIPLPMFNNFALLNPVSWIPTGVGTMTGYYKAYFFYYLISTMIFAMLEAIYNQYAKLKKREKIVDQVDAKVRVKEMKAEGREWKNEQVIGD